MTKKQLIEELQAAKNALAMVTATGELMCGQGFVADAEGCRQLYLEVSDAVRQKKKAQSQRDLVVRRLHHVLETLDSLDVQLGQEGVSRVVRVHG